VSHSGDGACTGVNYGDGGEQEQNAVMTPTAAAAAATTQCSCAVILLLTERSIDIDYSIYHNISAAGGIAKHNV
jgi:hypothetical protein